MATLKNVCLSCGDKLQAQGVMVLSVERYRNMEKSASDTRKKLDQLKANLALLEIVEPSDNPPQMGEKD